MNDSSSRTHCMIHLKFYRKLGPQCHVANFRLFDLAGSEKYGKTDPSKFNMGSTSKLDWPIEALEALGQNVCLLYMAEVIKHFVTLPPLTGG